MSSPYYSLVPKSQKPYATPWFQKQYTNIPIPIEAELENAISQIVSENDISRVPSSDAIFKYLLMQLSSVILATRDNTFTKTNNFVAPIVSTSNINIGDNLNTNLVPNAGSIKSYIDLIISGGLDFTDLLNRIYSNSYTYLSTTPSMEHIITHNLNSEFINYSVLIWDQDLLLYKNHIVAVTEINTNQILVELNVSLNIKVVINKAVINDNVFTYISEQALTEHTLVHNLNALYLQYNVVVYDIVNNIYKTHLLSITELDQNTLFIESETPIIIKATIVRVSTN